MTDTYNRLTYIGLKCLCQKEEYLWDTEQIKNAAGVLDTILQTWKKNVIVSRGFGLVKVKDFFRIKGIFKKEGYHCSS